MGERSGERSHLVADLVTSVQEWVESITDHPNQWAGEEDMAMIRALRRLVPGVRCRWLENPNYAGWTDFTDPAAAHIGSSEATDG